MLPPNMLLSVALFIYILSMVVGEVSAICDGQGRRAGVFKVFTNTNFFPNNF